MYSVNETPIIVLGNQKSGTSAISHLLADYGDLSKTIDIPPLWGYRGLEVMQEQTFPQVVESHPYWFSSDLIKEPMMTFFSEQVAERFPAAKYVFIVRDPRDNIRSLLDSRDLPGNRSHLRPEDVEHLSSSRSLLDSDAWGISAETYIELLAKRWVLAVQNLSRLQEITSAVQVVKYEHFNQDKMATISETASSLDIPERNDISSKLDVAFQPRGSHRDVDWKSFFGPHNLQTINRICSEQMSNLNYQT